MILLTGAAGKTGRAVLRALSRGSEPVRALVHRRPQVEAVRALGAAEALAGDLLDPDLLRRAAAGVRAVYHICPNVSPQEVAAAELLLDAMRRAGSARLVYHSVLHPLTEAMPHHRAKLRVEEMLVESGLPWTVLQPAPYMQNLLAQAGAVHREGVYRVPYSPAARFSWVDLEDVAAAAAHVLSEPGHDSGAYALCGPRAVSGEELAALWSRAAGRPVRAEAQSLEEWRSASGLRGYALEALSAMFRFYDRHGLTGSPLVLTCLLGRAPAGLETFLAREAAARAG